MGRVREVFAAMGREMRENKGSFAVYVVLRLIVLVCAVGSALAFDNYEAFFLCLLTLVLFLVPYVHRGELQHLHPRDARGGQSRCSSSRPKILGGAAPLLPPSLPF